MKLTKSKLKKLIKEELENILQEGNKAFRPPQQVVRALKDNGYTPVKIIGLPDGTYKLENRNQAGLIGDDARFAVVLNSTGPGPSISDIIIRNGQAVLPAGSDTNIVQRLGYFELAALGPAR